MEKTLRIVLNATVDEWKEVASGLNWLTDDVTLDLKHRVIIKEFARTISNACSFVPPEKGN